MPSLANANDDDELLHVHETFSPGKTRPLHPQVHTSLSTFVETTTPAATTSKTV